MESTSALTINNEETVDMVYKENSGYCYSDAYTYYLKENEAYRNLDNEKTESAFADLSEFSWEECADYYAEDSELASYGLEEPAAEVSIVYTPVQEEGEEEEAETSENSAEQTEEEQEFSYQVGTANDTYGRTGLLSVQWFLLHLCAERRRDQLCGQRVGRGSERGCKFCDPGYKL